MLQLTHSLQAWNTEAFSKILKTEIEELETGSPPLYKATSQGGYVDDSNISVTILTISDNSRTIMINAGVFFSEIVGGCSCGDDPRDENVYCEIRIIIDKKNAETVFSIISA